MSISVPQKDDLRCVENCLVEIVSWMNSNMLKINSDKTEVIVFTSQKTENHIESISVKIGGEDIKPYKCVSNTVHGS